jgi:hypothetical protein
MWLFHCHIDWHIVMGMSVVFDVASERVGKYPIDYPLCGSAVQRAAVDAESCKSQLGADDASDDSERTTLGLAGVVAVSVLVTCVGTVCIVFLILYFLGTRYVPTLRSDDEKPLSSSSSDRVEAETELPNKL